jgi:hypothetical protein
MAARSPIRRAISGISLDNRAMSGVPERAPAEQAAPRPARASRSAAGHPLLALQRTAGNRATTRLLQRRFWELTPDGSYVWHDEDPDAAFEPVRDPGGSTERYGRWYDLWSYDVYQRHNGGTPAVSGPTPQAVAAPAPVQPRPPKVKRTPPPREPATVPPIKEEKDRLLEQVGPSCYLFVIEAMARVRGLDTGLLATILYLYPDPAGGDTLDRVERVQVVEQRLKKLDAQLQSHLSALPRGGPTHMPYETLVRLAHRWLTDVKEAPLWSFVVRLLTPLAATPDGYEVAAVHQQLKAGAAMAKRLADEIGKPAQNSELDEEAKLLGGAWTIVDKDVGDRDLADLIPSLMKASGGVVLMGIGQRFHPQRYDKDPTVHKSADVYDFTGVAPAEIKSGGPHAVLVVACDPSARTLTYKDPNFGEPRVTITFDHLRRMAELWGKVEFYAMPEVSRSGAGIRAVLA